MGNLQFSINYPIDPEKLMSFITNFDLYQEFFPNQIKKSYNTETGYREFFTKMKIFNCKYIIPDNFKNNPNDIRLTLDYEEDLNLANEIFSELGDNFSYNDVLNLFEHKPSLHEITKPLIKKWNKHYQDNITNYELK